MKYKTYIYWSQKRTIPVSEIIFIFLNNLLSDYTLENIFLLKRSSPVLRCGSLEENSLFHLTTYECIFIVNLINSINEIIISELIANRHSIPVWRIQIQWRTLAKQAHDQTQTIHTVGGYSHNSCIPQKNMIRKLRKSTQYGSLLCFYFYTDNVI